jgi:hypothetical protein
MEDLLDKVDEVSTDDDERREPGLEHSLELERDECLEDVEDKVRGLSEVLPTSMGHALIFTQSICDQILAPILAGNQLSFQARTSIGKTNFLHLLMSTSSPTLAPRRLQKRSMVYVYIQFHLRGG